MREANALYWSTGGTGFVRERDETSGLADLGIGRSVVACDVNRDGLLDLFTTNNRGIDTALPRDASRLWINSGIGAVDNGWLAVRLVGRDSNLEGIGARVDARVGATTLKRQVVADTVYLGGSTREVHLGLGAAEVVDRLTIRWPSGVDQDLIGVAANRHLVVLEPAVASASPVEIFGGGAQRKLKMSVANPTGVPQIGTLAVIARTTGGEAIVLAEEAAIFIAGASNVSAKIAKTAIPAGTVELGLRVTVDGTSDDETTTAK